MFEMSLATVEDRHIYKIGGTQSDEKFCNRYDIQTDTWHTAPSLSAVRRRHSNCVLAGVLYVYQASYVWSGCEGAWPVEVL